jgi:hypothetical protein
MKTATLAILSLALLSACGERNAAPAAAGASTDEASAAAGQAAEDARYAAAEAQRARAKAQQDAQFGQRLLDYKRAMLPLIAGSYSGACTDKAGVKSLAAITVAADGTVSAPGVPPRSMLDAGAMLSLIRQPSVGAQKPLSFVAGAESPRWAASGYPGSTMGSMFGSEDGAALGCEDDSDAPVKPVPLYPVLARFFAAAATTISCNDGPSLPRPRPFKITPSATGVSIGSDTVSFLRPNAGETTTAGGGDNGLIYRLEMLDGETVQMHLDRSGKLSTFSWLGGPGKKMYSCFPG